MSQQTKCDDCGRVKKADEKGWVNGHVSKNTDRAYQSASMDFCPRCVRKQDNPMQLPMVKKQMEESMTRAVAADLAPAVPKKRRRRR